MATYLDLMFRDTIAGSMLRTLMLKRSMTQRDFMRVYHERCGRSQAKTKSAFGNNFGRFIARQQAWWGWQLDGEEEIRWYEYHSDLGCIAHHRPITGRDSAERMNRLEWSRPSGAALLATADDRTLDRIEQVLERVALRDDSVVATEARLLLDDARREMRVRSARPPQHERAGAAVRKLYDAVTHAIAPVTFDDWYSDGAELAVKLRGKALTAWKALRALAESANLTVGEYLDAYGIHWASENADVLPRCVREMGCACALHARAGKPSTPCDATEES